ncbi:MULTISPECIES: exopolyphosphatase [Spiribacter]|jgi:exopolyphosphatase/guanosine-5'-triphosphate,3'-diphosphate pyrophosphatase|uniref:Exopolyphosphatase n=1 Tax=Spiribacter aquaticus TaxID=1935996 RepID=A0A557RHL2_9GAMM|nr:MULTISPECIES: exopolyphosphatase [Spiribacter]KAF0280617.1 exopolyphosphatase [Spiribacter roseus]KAF0284233.1 exopolyphosphatase [Spiribacter roseus]KAF0286532.1 exopolyphosphatase [Spiribacter sp. SSL99]TVO64635.1 exopolyphosphatase [Spiribacter aquaticus]
MAVDAAPTHDPVNEADEIAAVDLGSNSFHMIIARPDESGLRTHDRLRESVRLAAGLDAEKRLSADARARALACLERFGQRVRELPEGAVRAVGTNTLRQSRNSRAFLREAEQALGHPIQIVSGYEEARLIYLGVAHSIADDEDRRLVMDIGGGSTEFIIGEHFVPREMESLHMGCVSTTQRFFSDGVITDKRLRQAEIAARRELEPIADRYRRLGWERAIGASGTIRAIERCLRENGWTAGGIDPKGLQKLRRALVKAGDIKRLKLDGVNASRAEVLPGGLAVLLGAFQQLGLEQMEAADGALREGLLFDLIGRIRHADVRTASVRAMAERYHVDQDQARRVATLADSLRGEVATDWGLATPAARDTLQWAAWVHEIGLDISHSQYHKHGEYIVRHSDLAGFAREEQQLLATLIRAHRRKFPRNAFRELPEDWQTASVRLAVLLRLAVTLQRARSDEPLPALTLKAAGRKLTVRFPAGWLDDNPLVEADLSEEAGFLEAAGFRLRINRD